DTKEFIAGISEALSAHLENLRLTAATENALAETETQARRLARMNILAEQLSASGDLTMIYNLTSQSTRELIGAEHVSVALENKNGKLDLFALDSLSGATLIGNPIPVEGSTVGLAIRDRKILSFVDVREVDEFLDNTELAKQGIRSALIAPLLAGGKVMGALIVGHHFVQGFSAQEEFLLQQIAALFATTLENRRLFTETTRRAEREALINSINQRIQGSTTVETALEITVREVGTLLNARLASVELSPGSDNR
ncbi:MAG: GAF domain-containing protein, partial [Anaerolineae bacterium]|nr:GAF domain-containing protein [Anaerolineae bacterium]